MMKHRLSIATPDDFDFWRTAFSHGWCDLPPFSFDADRRTLDRVLMLNDRRAVHCRLRGGNGSIQVSVSAHLSGNDRRQIQEQLRSCLRLGEEFGPFYKEARRYPRYRWIPRSRAGRLLRSPTVFEDSLKMLCTTNCTWALTRIMVTKLVLHFGVPWDHGKAGFPAPASIADSTEAYLREKCSTGYRAPYILEFARRVARGELDPESWRTSTLPTAELFEIIRTVKGFGPYAAGNILKLLGRYDYLGLDSWVRGRYAELHHGGRRVKDSTIERAYAGYGPWRGLFFWLEMTRSWHADKFDF
jgi:N-glycosylase/DNA lyase